MRVKIKKLVPDAKIPTFAHDGDVGADCYVVGFDDDYGQELCYLEPGERVKCNLGFAIELPKGYYAQMVPRSGLALKKGLTIANTPGTIDNGYRGEICAIVANISRKTAVIKKGDRVAQLIVRKSVPFFFEEVDSLGNTQRGEKGFGSTGD